jgi:translation initiation factor IF-2
MPRRQIRTGLESRDAAHMPRARGEGGRSAFLPLQASPDHARRTISSPTRSPPPPATMQALKGALPRGAPAKGSPARSNRALTPAPPTPQAAPWCPSSRGPAWPAWRQVRPRRGRARPPPVRTAPSIHAPRPRRPPAGGKVVARAASTPSVRRRAGARPRRGARRGASHHHGAAARPGAGTTRPRAVRAPGRGGRCGGGRGGGPGEHGAAAGAIGPPASCRRPRRWLPPPVAAPAAA